MNYCDRNNDVAIGITNIHIAANLLSRTEIPPIKKKKELKYLWIIILKDGCFNIMPQLPGR